MKAIQDKYGVDFLSSPPSPSSIESLSSELTSLQRKIIENENTKPLLMLFNYRIQLLESDRLLIEGFKWGAASTTEFGFGCRKGENRILNSSRLRNGSANAGFASALALQQFIESSPDRASALNLTQHTFISLTANSAIVQKQAERDYKIVTNFCSEEITIEQVIDLNLSIPITGTKEQ